jgi:hypothetical protein
MDDLVLTDPRIFPDDSVITQALGKAHPLWLKFFQELRAAHPALATEWRYYNDGKSWLMKVTHKKKTVVWVTVHAGFFRITAYLTEKARAVVEGSDLSDDCKDQFANSKRFGKLIAVSVPFKKKTDVKSGLALVTLKLALK